MDTFRKCFSTILLDDEKESREAARRVRKLIYSRASQNKEKYEDIAKHIETAPEKYRKISEDWRQENFVTAVSVMYFLHDIEAQPDFLFPWLLHLLQHSNGVIRYAAVKMLSQELGPLTVHIRCPDPLAAYSEEITPEQADSILSALYMNLDDLSTKLQKPSYKKYKYIESLPSCPYKSVQMVLANMVEYCGQKYINKLFPKKK
jgi:hypothetical protein